MSLSEARTELFALCENMSDEAYTALEASDLTMTAKGFWRGQKSAAKAISRAMSDVFRDLASRQEGSAGDDGAAMRHTLSVQATDKVFTVIAIVVGTALAIYAFIRWMITSEPPPYSMDWEAREEERRRNWEAWRFFDWCNSIPLAELAANPPAERFKISRGPTGMWSVYAYMGVGPGRRRYTMMINHLEWPVAIPDATNRWDFIGPKEGFLTYEAAKEFARRFAFDIAKPVALDANLKRLES